MALSAQLRVGTSGWSYPHWAKGVFYPRGLKQGDWLRFYADHFDTVEVNMTFYRLPRKELLERWVSMTPSRFRFAVKLWRRITHFKKLAECEEELETFVETMSVLGAKHGPLLVQLPPTLHCDLERLDTLLTMLRTARGRRRWPVAVEFRHKSWLCTEAYAVLVKHAATVCLADMPRCPVVTPNSAPIIYIRRHGPTGRYHGSYTKNRLKSDAKAIHGWVADDRTVYAYFNNDNDGHAVTNAKTLCSMTA